MDFDLFVIGGGSAGVRCARIPLAMAPELVSPRSGSGAAPASRSAVCRRSYWCRPENMAHGRRTRPDSAGRYRKGPHDWTKLIAAKDREITRLEGIYRKLLTGAGATIFDARAMLVDPHAVEVGGKRFTAKNIVIATGGHPERPDIPGAELGIISDDAFYLRTMPQRVVDGRLRLYRGGIRRHLPCAGGRGASGLSPAVAAAWLRPGNPRGDGGGAGSHKASSCIPTACRTGGSGWRPPCPDLWRGRRLDADLVFFATGRRANTAALGLEEAGVRAERKGASGSTISLRTTQPHIYAMGDVTDRVNLTPVATAEGHALADTLVRRQPPHSLDVECSVGGVHHPAACDGGPDRGTGVHAGSGGHLT